MSSVRPMEPRDAQGSIELGYRMHQESVYRDFDYDTNKVGRMLYHYSTNPDTHFMQVAEVDGELVGLFLGAISEHYFGTDRLASDTLWYVAPEHRGSRVGLDLLRAFEKWGTSHKVAEICVGVSSGLSTDKTGTLLQKLGYDLVGGNYKLRVAV